MGVGSGWWTYPALGRFIASVIAKVLATPAKGLKARYEDIFMVTVYNSDFAVKERRKLHKAGFLSISFLFQPQLKMNMSVEGLVLMRGEG